MFKLGSPQEFRVAERLFLPDSMKSTNKTLDAAYEILSPKESQLHLRISKRQREKQEKELQRKKEAAAEKELAGKIICMRLERSVWTTFL